MAKQEETGQREEAEVASETELKDELNHALTHWLATLSDLQSHLWWFE